MRARVLDHLRGCHLASTNQTTTAKALHCSTATLRRKLAKEGTSYQEMLDQVRTEQLRAITHNNGKAAGYQLGFTSANSFYRWHKGKLGETYSGRTRA